MKRIQDEKKRVKELFARKYWDFIQKNDDKNWIMHELYSNPLLTWNIISQHLPTSSWDWVSICINPNITLDIVKNNLNLPWEWYFISRNPNITWDMIQKNPNLPWDWSGLTHNPNITSEIILNNMDKEWSWYNICSKKILVWI